MTVFEVAERLPEPEDSRASEGPEDHRQWVEFALATEMMKCYTGQGRRKPPPAPIRPVQHNCTIFQPRKQPLLDIVVPDRTV